jgi:hypothetical protein
MDLLDLEVLGNHFVLTVTDLIIPNANFKGHVIACMVGHHKI